MYYLEQDKARHRLLVNFISFADIDQDKLGRELRAGALSVKAGGSYFDLLVDFTQAPVMSQDTAADSKSEIEWCIANGLRRSANVMTSAIAKMQVQRLSADGRFQMFTNRDEAVAWLDSPD